jgi:hypothetical protein
MKAPERAPETRKATVLQMGPQPAGFLSRYLLALTPLVLIGVSVITTGFMQGLLTGSFTSAMQGPAGAVVAGMADIIEITILLIAPVGIYLTFVLIGWMIRSTEIWAGSALALGLATLWGAILVTITPETSLNPVLDLLSWIAYLASPASSAAFIIILAWIELTRRSIRYTITREHLGMKGGIWKSEEHHLPWHQIGGLVMEQSLPEKLTGTGTIIPLEKGENTGRDRKAGKGLFRSPLDCLCGVKEPGLILEFLQELVARSHGAREEPASPSGGPESR